MKAQVSVLEDEHFGFATPRTATGHPWGLHSVTCVLCPDTGTENVLPQDERPVFQWKREDFPKTEHDVWDFFCNHSHLALPYKKV